MELVEVKKVEKVELVGDWVEKVEKEAGKEAAH